VKERRVNKKVFILLTLVISCAVFLTFFSHIHWQDFSITNEKPIVVVITSYNNEQWCERNLRMLFAQKYTNWRAVYINDCSSDSTLQEIERIIKEAGQEHRVQVINNAKRCGKMANLYHAIHTIHDRAIVLDYDGDDWFKHDQVFQVLNQAYSDPNVWCTYGQYENYPSKKLGLCKPLQDSVIKNNTYRSSEWVTSQQRTFYAGLFKRIKKEDFFYDGDFYPITSDQAYMLPILELAGGKVKFISEVLYVYNNVNPINDYKERVRLQQVCCHHVRSRNQYQSLTEDQFVMCSQEIIQ
jgi:glycosyltransferase involved in cell wall biosynthesis